MWSKLLLCLLVGLAYASDNPAWKENYEYVYQVRGRTLTSFDEISDDYSGVVLRAKLTVSPKSNGTLYAKISDAETSQLHTQLPHGWQSEIPESQLAYKPLQLSNQPFKIEMRNGVVSNLIVNKEVPNWEANIIKSIVSQIQLDTKAENLIRSHVNAPPQEVEDSNNAVYKTMEDTVTGISETLYEIHPMPKYVLQSQPWLAPLRHLEAVGEIIEVVKSKNYSHSEERPSYHYGFTDLDNFEPNSNQMGEFFTRNSVSRAVLTGSLKSYTVQNSYTINKIMVSPTLADKQKGFVNSKLNITLQSVQEQKGEQQELSDPVALGSLVYRYNSPYSASNEARQGRQHQAPSQKEDSKSDSSSSEEEQTNGQRYKRFLRKPKPDHSEYSNSMSDNSVSSEEYWQQEQPKLNEAPDSPLLPLNVGYRGQSIKKDLSVTEIAVKLALQIGEAMQNPEKHSMEETVGKFVALTSIMRTMNEKEMQKVAAEVYSKDQEGEKRETWVAFRDAVAQSGTGPALLLIQDWIKTEKIQKNEAGAVVASAAHAARQPTEEYMRSFYQMINAQEVMSQNYLNESALFAFTKLAYSVYVNKDYSHNKYPSHSFGGFRTESGKRFLKSEVIPHMAKKLEEAIERADNEQIHVYIRALGNIGHQQILAVFEPYMEGKKHVSQFQRILMVVALDKLVEADPKLARSVLYKIYQNSAERELVRVAAVYRLMRTAPPAEMLQRMAAYTHEDSSECVNAAVQSAIRSASELRGAEFKPLRAAAESAKHLLTKKEYGHSEDKLRSYVIQEMNFAYKQSFQSYRSDDSYLPSGIQYTLRSKLGGVNQRVFNMQAMVSSIDDLTQVAREQTEEYRQHQQQQEKSQDKYSSENIAKLLNMQSNDREQLEGYYYVQIESLQKMMSFDNRTMENLPRALREYEQALKNGQTFHHTKMVINNEMVVSFPTETGLPFIYTYDEPNIVRFQGKVQAKANPEVSDGKLLKKPDNVDAEFKFDASITYRTQSQLGFVTPNDHQRYSAGYDKNFQAQLPIRGKMQVDMKNQEIKAEIQTTQPEKDAKLMHFSTVPYTYKGEIFAPWRDNKQVIRGRDQHHYEQTIGDKSTGIAVEFKSTSDRQMDAAWLYRKMQKHDPISALMSPWADENIQYTEINAKINSGKSQTNKVNIHLSYQKKYQSRQQDESNDSKGDDISEFERMPEEQDKRRERFMRNAAAGIHGADVGVVDAQIEFHGAQEQIKYRATAAAARSDADPKSRVLFYMRRNGNEQQRRPFQIALNARSHIPNTNGLNLDNAMEFDPTSTTQMQLAIGENFEKSMKFDVQVQARKSEDRKEYLKQEPEYYECQRQMKQGNTQLPTCAHMTARANLLDRVNIKIQYDNIQPSALNATYKMYSAIRHYLYPSIEENFMTSEDNENKVVNIEARFEPDMPNQRASVSIKTQYGRMHINNIEMNDWVKQIVVPHPVFNMKTRLTAKSLRLYNYRPICVVDKHAASTFANKTYPIKLTNFWTVMLQYVPRRPSYNQQGRQQSVEEQLERQVENYNVLVRASKHGSEKKEVKINVRTPQTQGKHVDVTLESAQTQPKVTVNGKEVQYNSQQITDVNNGSIRIYALPYGEVKVEVNNAFYVIYDGVRVKLTVTNGKFRNAVRGTCGSFNDEKDTDFEAPSNCILHDSKELVATYTVLEKGQRHTELESLKHHSQNQCYQREFSATNVISDRDAGRKQSQREPRGMCTKHQTRYTTENGQICFTLRPVPVCKKECQQRGTVSQNISVHCVAQSNVADLWKKQIDKGASPDFSLKSETKTIRMEIPQSCSQ